MEVSDSISCSPSSSTASSSSSSSNQYVLESESPTVLLEFPYPWNHVNISSTPLSPHRSFIGNHSPQYSYYSLMHVNRITGNSAENAHLLMESPFSRNLVSTNDSHSENKSVNGVRQRKNMKKPSTKETKRPLLKCSVCRTDTHYSFYGSVSCDPCRTFFRRQVLSGRPLECLQNQECSVEGTNRKACSWCRFQKCLNVGMRVEMVEQDVLKNRRTREEQTAISENLQEMKDKEVRSDNFSHSSNVPEASDDSHNGHQSNSTGSMHSLVSLITNRLHEGHHHPYSRQQLNNKMKNIFGPSFSSQSSFPLQQSSYNNNLPLNRSTNLMNPRSFQNNLTTNPSSTLYWPSNDPSFCFNRLASDNRLLSHRILSHRIEEDTMSVEGNSDFSSQEMDCQDISPPREMLRFEDSSDLIPQKTHPYLYVRRPENSNMDFRVLDVTGTPCVVYKILLEVSVKGGVVCGTDAKLEDLLDFENSHTILPVSDFVTPSVDVTDGPSSTTLILEDHSISGCRLQFFRSIETVVIESSSRSTTSFCTPVTLEGINEDHWCRLSQVISSNSLFRDIMTVKYSIPEKSVTSTFDEDEDERKQEILLTVSIDSFMKFITRACQSIDAFRSLPQMDQLLLIKDCVVEMGYLNIIHTYDRDWESIIWYSFNRSLLFCSTIDVFRTEPLTSGPLFSSFRELVADFSDFLRKDPIVVNILSLLLLFKEDTYQSCLSVIQRERKLYLELLEKYISGKVKSGDWKDVTTESVLKHIQGKLSHIRRMRVLYENLSLMEPQTQEVGSSSKVLGDVLEYMIDLEGIPSPSAITSTESCIAYSASQSDNFNNHVSNGNHHCTERSSMGVDGTFENDPTHFWLSLRKPPNSNLEYRVIDIVGIPCISYKITIEVPVLDDIICNTTCNFQDLIEYNQSPKITPCVGASQLVLNNAIGRTGQQIFQAEWRTMKGTSKATADVFIASSVSGKVVMMELMTECLWNRLSQVIEASPFLYEILHVRYGYPSASHGLAIKSSSPEIILSGVSETSSLNHEVIKRQLLLTVSLDTVSKPVYEAFQLFETFQALPESDQFILMKECIMEVCFLHSVTTFDKKADSFIFPCLQVMSCLHAFFNTALL